MKKIEYLVYDKARCVGVARKDQLERDMILHEGKVEGLLDNRCPSPESGQDYFHPDMPSNIGWSRELVDGILDCQGFFDIFEPEGYVVLRDIYTLCIIGERYIWCIAPRIYEVSE